jgi:tetratricopeptide (TPR) repeat protein
MKQTFQRAIDDLNRAIEIDPMKASAFVFRGDVFQALGRPNLAYSDYNTAVKLEPDVADWVKRRDGAAKFVGRRVRTKMASRYLRDVFRAGLARATDSQAASKVSDTVKRWENGEVSLQEAMQAFDGGNPRCVLAYP